MMKITIDEEMEKVYSDFVEKSGNASILHNKYLVQPEELKSKLPFWKLKLTAMQLNIIYHVDSAGEMAMGSLAKSQSVAKSVISQPVNKLLQLNIFRRFQKSDNYRYIYVTLTDYGRELLKEQNRIVRDYLIQKFYSVMSKDDLIKMTECYSIIGEALKRFEKLDDEKLSSKKKVYSRNRCLTKSDDNTLTNPDTLTNAEILTN